MECTKCGRELKDKKSKERGYGPVCWEKEKECPHCGGEMNVDMSDGPVTANCDDCGYERVLF
ncbi:DUF6011 domain-containing protein [Tuberibacillus sp. Marseille-P3662]|uniref:DUF6011 domain-containing protein n=1 Tax=Tuberibacillus sp. Marseille-P3662 TaxID=1965358 RepID=UPI000A1CEB5F|nr:DUF6011 domain-containing protein [Tuberibacillus sp. Marseille-P3662]